MARTYFFYFKRAAQMEAKGAKRDGFKTSIRKLTDGYLLTLKKRRS